MDWKDIYEPDELAYCSPPDFQEISWVLVYGDQSIKPRYFFGVDAEENARAAWREDCRSLSATLMCTVETKYNDIDEGNITTWQASPQLRYVKRRRHRAAPINVLQQLWEGFRFAENGIPISPIIEWRDVPFEKELEYEKEPEKLETEKGDG